MQKDTGTSASSTTTGRVRHRKRSNEVNCLKLDFSLQIIIWFCLLKNIVLGLFMLNSTYTMDKICQMNLIMENK